MRLIIVCNVMFVMLKHHCDFKVTKLHPSMIKTDNCDICQNQDGLHSRQGEMLR